MRDAAVHRNEIDPVAMLEAEVEQAIALCQGDLRAALRATLIANAYLEAEVSDLMRKVSQGYARKRRTRPMPPPNKAQTPE